MHHSFARLALLLLSVGAGASHAVAAVLPPYYSSETRGSHALVPTPTVQADAGALFANSTLTYYFEVVGPSGTMATVDISGFLSAKESYFGSSVAYFYGSLPKYDDFAWINVGSSSFVTGSPGFLFAGIGSAGTRSSIDGSDSGGQFGYVGAPTIVQKITPDSATSTTTLNLKGVFTLPTDTIYTVEISAFAGAGYDTPGLLISSSQVLSDPYIAIDPSFATGHSGYDIVVSEGVGNSAVSSVPEADTVDLFVLGLSAVLLSAPRTRRNP